MCGYIQYSLIGLCPDKTVVQIGYRLVNGNRISPVTIRALCETGSDDTEEGSIRLYGASLTGRQPERSLWRVRATVLPSPGWIPVAYRRRARLIP